MSSRRHFLASATGAAAALTLPMTAAAQLGSRWEQVSGTATDIAIGSNGQIWALGDKPAQGGRQVFRRDGSKWTAVAGGLTSIAVDPMANAWGTNDANNIYNYDGRRWNRLPGQAVDIAVGPQASVFCLGIATSSGGNEIYEWNGSSWKKAGFAGVRVAVDTNGQPWVVRADDAIFRRDRGQWTQVPGAARDIGIGADGSVWVIGTDQKGEDGYGIHRWNGKAWQTIDGIATVITVAPNGMPWALNAKNQIFQRV